MLTIANHNFQSRLFLGTGKFSSAKLMQQAIIDSGTELVTLALKRVDFQRSDESIYHPIKALGVQLLPNTSGAKTAEEAIYAARLCRELFNTHWLKLEIHPEQKYLMPDPIETLKAAEMLVKEGFTVLPYCHADPVLCQRLAEVGCAAVMPLAAPIGSNQGLRAQDFLEIIIEQSQVPVIVDAGIGRPSDAALAMELGADAVLVNTAIATARDPSQMAKGFRLAVEGGRYGANALGAGIAANANASSPNTDFLQDWE